MPGLAVEEFSTPPSSPMLARTIRKAAALATDSVHYKSVATTSKDSINNMNNIIQLGEYVEDNNNMVGYGYLNV